MEGEKETAAKLSNGTSFNDLTAAVSQISTYGLPFSMTLSDL